MDLRALFSPDPATATPRQRMRQRHLPNVPLLTHEGRPVRFYDDLVRDRKVVINFMYSVCSNICTPATRNLQMARQHLGKFADDLHFYSISLTPLADDPKTLRAYRQSFGIEGAGWTFLTGSVDSVEQVQRGLGLAGEAGAARDGLEDHSGTIRIGDEAQVRWGHAASLANGRAIARMIRFALV